MKAGVSSVDITPPIGVPLGGNPRPCNAARSIHDRLAANAICLAQDSGEKLLFIGLDLLGIDKELCDEIKGEIEKDTGIPARQIMISATHTHSGPNVPRLYYTAYADPKVMEEEDAVLTAYRPYLRAQVVRAACNAVKGLFICRLSFGIADDDRFSVNRRLRMKDGSIRMIFEEFDLADIEEISEPKSAPAVSVLRIADTEGRIRALYVHYATHPAIACGLDFAISRDFIGYMTDELKRTYGEEIVVLYANGAEGNMCAAYPQNGFIDTFEECERVGLGLAETVCGVIREMDTRPDSGMAGQEGSETEKGKTEVEDLCFQFADTIVQLPIRRFSEAEVNEAETYISEAPSDMPMHGAPKLLSALAVRKFHAMEGRTEDVYLQAFAIGDTLILAAPTETFRQIAIEAEGKWKRGPVVFVGLANGYSGYVPTEAAFSEGGYEVLPNEDSYFAPEAERIFKEGLFLLIEKLQK